MKGLLIKCLKIFLILAIVAIVILVVFGAVFALDWPWWMGIFVLMGLIGLGIGLLFVRKILLRRREQRFVHQIIEHDEVYLKGLEREEKEPLKELQDRWKEAIERLRRSHLKKYGNPLYVLPWYLIIGESGSGKTTAITSARLSSPFAEVSRTSGISGTRNCDWWFFDEAIILDTAGRYAIPIDESRDKEEWQGFLNLLIRYRKRESLNGLVVTIAADKLFQADRKTLEEDGRDIRRRIDELMRVLGAKFPVYVLVTKCDLIQGMTRFCDHLPANRLEQPMGCINQDLTRDVMGFHEQTTATMCDHLRDFRLLILHQSPTEGVDPSFLLFPEEFEKLKPGLGAFIKGAFQESPYQETPTLRGLFFSSGCQEGTPYSHFLRALGLIGEGEVLPGTSKGLFLHDFFAKVLPKDRGLLAPTQRALEWQRISRNLGLSSWIALGVAVCGLLSFSFVKNLTVKNIPRQFLEPPVLTGDFVSDVRTMEYFRGEVLKVEAANRDWWIPRFGLTHSQEFEITLKSSYCGPFQKEFLASLDAQMQDRITKLSGAAPDEIIVPYVEHQATRFNLVNARLGGKGFEDLKKMPPPSCQLILADPERVDEINERFGDLYFSYLVWISSDDLGREKNALQGRLEQIPGKDLKWLVAWVNRQDSLADITMEDFWERSVPISKKAVVERAFTREGKAELDRFLREMEAAFPDPAVIASRRGEFERWYRDEYLAAWRNFATCFPRGEDALRGLKGIRERQQVAAKMASGEGPYYAFLDRMALELEPVVESQNRPSWVDQLYRFQLIKAQSLGDRVSEDKGLLEKAKQKIERLRTLFGKHLPKVYDESLEAYRKHREALNQVAPAAESREVSSKLTAQVFSDDPATSEALFFKAHKALNELRRAVSARHKTDETVWKLIKGPFDYLWSFVVHETGCKLNGEWEEKVLRKVEGYSDRPRREMVWRDNGLAWEFVEGPAAPFIEYRKGCKAKKVLGREIDFEQSFFGLLKRGDAWRKQNIEVEPLYKIPVEAFGAEVNPGAAKLPHETRLKLKCERGDQVLRNWMYPTSRVFEWSPDACSGVTLEIDVGNLTLAKPYTAFPDFLKDFRKGEYTFHLAEFPRGKRALKRMGIKYITVLYQVGGHIPSIPSPPEVPRKIVACWDQ